MFVKFTRPGSRRYVQLVECEVHQQSLRLRIHILREYEPDALLLLNSQFNLDFPGHTRVRRWTVHLSVAPWTRHGDKHL